MLQMVGLMDPAERYLVNEGRLSLAYVPMLYGAEICETQAQLRLKWLSTAGENAVT